MSATPQANSNLAQLGVVNGASGPYSVTNKNSGNGPQLPMPNSRNAQPGEPSSGARHSKLRNGSNNPSGAPKKAGAGRDNSSTLPAAAGVNAGASGTDQHHSKQVKPSELSLDLIIPSSIRGAKQSPISGANHHAK